MHIVVVKQGQDHLELPSGVGTKHEQQKPTKVRHRRGQDWPYLVVYYLQVLKDERKRGWGHDRPIVALALCETSRECRCKAAPYPLYFAAFFYYLFVLKSKKISNQRLILT